MQVQAIHFPVNQHSDGQVGKRLELIEPFFVVIWMEIRTIMIPNPLQLTTTGRVMSPVSTYQIFIAIGLPRLIVLPGLHLCFGKQCGVGVTARDAGLHITVTAQQRDGQQAVHAPAERAEVQRKTQQQKCGQGGYPFPVAHETVSIGFKSVTSAASIAQHTGVINLTQQSSKSSRHS